MRAATVRARGEVAEELGDAHGDGHGPVEERGLLEVADAVGVEGDVVVAEEHLAGDFGVDGVGVVEEWRGEEGEAGVEGDPEEEDGEERGARTWGRCGGHWDKCMRGGWRCCEPASQKRDTGHPDRARRGVG